MIVDFIVFFLRHLSKNSGTLYFLARAFSFKLSLCLYMLQYSLGGFTSLLSLLFILLRQYENKYNLHDKAHF